MSKRNTHRRVENHNIRPNMVEKLEERRLLAAGAVSTVGNETVQFTLQSNGNLQETIGKTQQNLGIVQGLYQGKDASGHEVAYEWAGKTLKEFTPTNGWVSIGAASAVTQNASQEVLFLQGSTLDMATGAPGAFDALLGNVNGLSLSGGQAEAQIGSYFKAGVTAQTSSTGKVTLQFANVQMNVGPFAASFLSSAISDLQTFTKPLQPLANVLTQPLLSGWGFTTVELLQQLGYGQAASAAQTFANIITDINGISSSLSASNTWVNLGSFTAQVVSPTQLVTLSSSIHATASGILKDFGGGISAALAQLNQVPGLQIGITNPQQLLKLITGENPTLFSYTLSFPNLISVSMQQQLASIPISPETFTELDLYADLAVNLSAAATFGFDPKGFFIQNANAVASLTVGLSGILNEADLAGVELSGDVTGSVTASLKGANSAGKLYVGQSGTGIAFSSPSFHFGINAALLGPVQMIDLAIDQYGPYLKHLLGTDAQTVADILDGHGVSIDQIATVLDTIYGFAPPVIAGVLHKLDVAEVQIAEALYNSVTTDVSVIANALYSEVSQSIDALAGALSAVDDSVGDVVNVLHQFDSNVSDLANAVWYNWENAANWGVNELAGALSSVSPDLGAVINALSSVVNDVSSVAFAVWHNWEGPVFYLRDLAQNLWNHWGGTAFNLNNLSAALSKIVPDLGSVINALSSVVNDVTQVASAVWNNFYGASFTLRNLAQNLWNDWGGATGFNLNNLSAALSTVVPNLGQVINALSSVVNDVGQVARAVWNDFVGGTFYLTDLAGALWNNWGGATGFYFSSLAGAISSIDSDVSQIVAALSTVVNDADQIAQAIWNNWEGTTVLYASDLTSAVEGFFGSAISDAWGFLESLF